MSRPPKRGLGGDFSTGDFGEFQADVDNLHMSERDLFPFERHGDVVHSSHETAGPNYDIPAGFSFVPESKALTTMSRVNLTVNTWQGEGWSATLDNGKSILLRLGPEIDKNLFERYTGRPMRVAGTWISEDEFLLANPYFSLLDVMGE